ELRFLHEFIADQKSVGGDTEAFANMILQSVYPKQVDAIRNPFFQSSIKRRLQMLTQLKNPRVTYFSRLAALPLLATVVFAFTAKKSESQAKPGVQITSSAIASDTIPKKAEIGSIDVRKNKEKNINEIEIHYTNGQSEVLTENEATARGLVNNDYSSRKLDSSRLFKQRIMLRNLSASPLFILDGKEVTKEEIEKLNPNTIQSVNVLKEASATAIYGEKGKNGVLIIQTKTQPSNEPLSIQENGQEVLKGNISKVQVTEPNSIQVEADNITVTGKKEEIVVQGYRKTPSNNEVTVVGTNLENTPVFERAEFAPSVDQEEWRRFLEKYTQPIVQEVGKNAQAGKYTVNVRFIVEKDG
ncbi:MAG: hypothetical protein EOO14_25270, partial [Chitinophagaceae bacterium]